MQVAHKTKKKGEFQGAKNDMVNFQFQKPPGEHDGRIRYLMSTNISLDEQNKRKNIRCLGTLRYTNKNVASTFCRRRFSGSV